MSCMKDTIDHSHVCDGCDWVAFCDVPRSECVVSDHRCRFDLRAALVAEAVRVYPQWVDYQAVVWCGVCPDEGTPASHVVNGYDVCDSGACQERADALVAGVSLLSA